MFVCLLLAAGCAPAAASLPAPTPQPDTPTVTNVSDALQAPPAARLHFGRIGLEQGLSQSVVLTILQDRQGFMWFGTQDGLNRYDGEDFRVFSPIDGDPTSLSDVWVCSLSLDAAGNLWVGTRQGGANRYDESTGHFTRYQHSKEDPFSLSHDNVHVIFSDAQGRLWFGTDLGLDLFDPQKGAFTHYTLPVEEGTSVITLADAPQGTLWVGGSSGLWRFDPATAGFEQIDLGAETVSINKVLPSADGALWLSSGRQGLFRYDPQTGKTQQYTEKEGLSTTGLNTLWLDPSGWLWVATNNGLDLLDPVSGNITHYRYDPNVPTTLSNEIILSLYQDTSGILWIGGFGGGVNTYDPLANQFIHYYNEPKDPKSLGYNSIFSMAADPNGTVWLGTYGGGLENFDPRTGTFSHYYNDPEDPNSLQNNLVYAVLPESADRVWLGTHTGLDWLDPRTGTFTHILHNSDDPLSLPPGPIFYIYKDSQGVIWVGAGGGLARFNPADQTFTRYSHDDNDPTSLSSDAIAGILEDHNGVLWVGTHGAGINRFDAATQSFKRYIHDPNTPGSLSNNAILVLYESQGGNIWVGTAGGGLNRYDPAEDSFEVYTTANGLPNNYIYGILEDEIGNLWLSTNFGLARFDSQTGQSRNYTTADGLQSNEFNMGAFGKDAEGRMYFGGINGLTVFRPSALVENRFVPPVSLVSVTQNGNPLQAESDPSVVRAITLRYPNNFFEFEFAALSFSQSNKNQYAYQLEGFDSDWYYAGTDRNGRYANLPGGTYTLLLKAANASGVWSEPMPAFTVTVVPPFWQTGWFAGLAVFALALGAFGAYRLRVHDVEVQKRELERQVAERTREIEQLFEKTKELAILEERNRLARDLHDSAKQKAFAALAQLGAARSLSNGNGDKSAKHLQEAETLVGEVIQEITFLIQEIHPAALKEKGLPAALREYVFEWGGRTGIDAALEINNERRLPLEIEQALYRSIQEALANVARHSEAKSVDLKLSFKTGGVSVAMVDDGQGFDPANRTNGMGLRSIRERVEGLGGAFYIDSALGQGTQIAIRIPLEE